MFGTAARLAQPYHAAIVVHYSCVPIAIGSMALVLDLKMDTDIWIPAISAVVVIGVVSLLSPELNASACPGAEVVEDCSKGINYVALVNAARMSTLPLSKVL